MVEPRCCLDVFILFNLKDTQWACCLLWEYCEAYVGSSGVEWDRVK